ncbi:copper homeostasis membrane protein CopD [Pseudomonas sp. FSL R10-1350]|uniref:copper homeostasis membrane protein CopD n=1 Tax=Pseudomonas TaxID=286 RepID=UPI000652CAA0|nr:MULTISPECIES: copper homeostasis membrane protein CopD [Pseudomonas]KMN09483.1 copper resistance protein CopD [Pseudomonas helleri]MQT61111.1 copper homeostasis membrane protein CopD [Pseudomonas sp. FSL R10-0399]MQU64019.1 copper homeostasis membrane protein CopD [Pseudomonas sp. FSL R10-1350]
MFSAMVVCRFVHFSAVLLLFGGWVFRPLLPGTLSGPRQQVQGAYRGLAWLALFSSLAWLLLTTFSMAGSWADTLDLATLKLVLGSTFFGQVWTAHLLFNGLLLIALYTTARFGLIAVVSFLLLATLAPVGHGAMLDGWQGQLLILNQMIHLLCVGAWVGGLPVLWWVLTRPAGVAVDAVLRRFSNVGFVLVAGIILTGLINTRVLTGALWPTPLFQGFALILLIKVVLVGLMLLLALFNLLMSRAGHFCVLRRSVAIEWLLGVSAVAAVSLLGTLPPLVVS